MYYCPIAIIDNFYSNPDELIQLSKNLRYIDFDCNGFLSGERSERLDTKNKKISDKIAARIYSLFYDLTKTNLEAKQDIFFYREKNKFTDSWVYKNDQIIEGLLFLTPDLPPGPAVTIYTYPFKNEDRLKEITSKISNSVEKDELDIIKDEYNSCFIKSLDVEYKFNRFVLFESGMWRKVRGETLENEKEYLTLNFISNFMYNDPPPFMRMDTPAELIKANFYS